MELPQFPKPGEFGADARVRLVAETGRYVFTNPGDGAAYEFDDERAAWFPMWNESLVEEQQSAYGTTEDPPETGDTGGAVPAKRAAHRAGRANTSVYVSGLPRDATAAEVAQYFAQCGAIMPDLATNEPRVRLYCDGDGAPKGDALVTYFKAPSVRLALDILDDSQFRATSAARIRVEEAEFGSKANSNDATEKAKRPRIDAKLAQRRLDQLERRLGWSEGSGEVAERHKRTVILKHMFTLDELEADVTLLLDLADDVRGECERLGKVTSVKVYDGSEDGVVAVKFKDEAAAGACVKVMNGRFFAGRQVEAAIYDGHTRYRSAKAAGGGADGGAGEARSDEEQRMARYADWLDADG